MPSMLGCCFIVIGNISVDFLSNDPKKSMSEYPKLMPLIPMVSIIDPGHVCASGSYTTDFHQKKRHFSDHFKSDLCFTVMV